MEKSEIVNYVDEYIKHIIDFSFFGDKFCKTVLKLRDDCIKDIEEILRKSGAFHTKKMSNTARREVYKRLDVLEKNILAHLEEILQMVISEESDWLSGPLSDFLKTKLNITPSCISKLRIAPVSNMGTVKDFPKNFTDKYRKLFSDIIAVSYVTDSTFLELRDSYNIRKQSINRGVQAEGETLGTSLGSIFDRIVFSENQDKITGYIWSSILDSSTCLVCGHLDGKIFRDITKVPFYPVHLRCRCILIPFTESIKKQLPESYSVWFERQSKDVKKTILGVGRFKLYEKGMKIKDFVNNGQKTPLSQLKIRN